MDMPFQANADGHHSQYRDLSYQEDMAIVLFLDIFFLHSFKAWMRGFHNLLKEKLSH
jgi:hypothetical protein